MSLIKHIEPGPFVKICCIGSLDEEDRAISAGAAALGLVSSMPSGPGIIDDLLIAEIAANVPPSFPTFLLTAFQYADDIIEQHQRCRTSIIQLVDRVQQDELIRLRTRLPGIKLVQVIHVRNEDSIEEALSVSSFVDAILLDSGNQGLEVKQLGGTGRVHDWKLSRRISDELKIPLFLAGGLNKNNVVQAITSVRPFGLDLCSGVHTLNKLDDSKLTDFFDALGQHRQ